MAAVWQLPDPVQGNNPLYQDDHYHQGLSPRGAMIIAFFNYLASLVMLGDST